MISVQDILEIPDLNLRLLAGSKSTSNPVRWVHITEVPDPTKWLKGGELLLTTGYGFVGAEEQQIEQLDGALKGIAAKLDEAGTAASRAQSFRAPGPPSSPARSPRGCTSTAYART